MAYAASCLYKKKKKKIQDFYPVTEITVPREVSISHVAGMYDKTLDMASS